MKTISKISVAGLAVIVVCSFLLFGCNNLTDDTRKPSVDEMLSSTEGFTEEEQSVIDRVNDGLSRLNSISFGSSYGKTKCTSFKDGVAIIKTAYNTDDVYEFVEQNIMQWGGLCSDPNSESFKEAQQNAVDNIKTNCQDEDGLKRDSTLLTKGILTGISEIKEVNYVEVLDGEELANYSQTLADISSVMDESVCDLAYSRLYNYLGLNYEIMGETDEAYVLERTTSSGEHEKITIYKSDGSYSEDDGERVK